MTRNILDPTLQRAITPLINLALSEDLAGGDITSSSTIPIDSRSHALLLAKQSGILAGMPIVALILREVDPRLHITTLFPEGSVINPGDKLGEISGPTRSLLAAERTALNFLQRLCGIATLTATYAAAIADTGARIVDTRKTIPGHRMLDKYAVRIGGGYNHRFNLADGVLIKDNHIAAVGGVTSAINAARKLAPHTLKIECEVASLSMAKEALTAGADIILLDNMSLEEMRACVKMINNRALTEASGGITLERVREIAECGVDLISSGALTHSAAALDISLNFYH